MNETKEKALYIDTLPDIPLETIVRFLSDSPRAENWPAFIRNIFPLYAVKGEMTAFLRSRFNELTIYGEEQNPRKYHALGAREGTSPNHIKGKWSDIVKYLTQSSSAGKAFYTLELNNHSYKKSKIRVCPRILREIFPNARNFNLLSYTDECALWIREFHDCILSLTIYDSNLLPHVAVFAKNVRHLSLDTTFKSGSGGENLWATVGKTLESISMKFCSEEMAEIASIQSFCRNLKDIHIQTSSRLMLEALCTCILSYGESLNYADLSFMTREQMERVIGTCTKAKFSLLAHENTLTAALDVIGEKLDSICVVRFENEVKGLPIDADWTKCSNIREITFSFEPTITIADFRRCFETPKSHLKHIELDIMETDGLNQIINTLAFRTGALERLSLKTMNKPDGTTFTKLVDRNKALKIISIEFLCLSYIEAVETVQSFLRAPELKEIEVDRI